MENRTLFVFVLCRRHIFWEKNKKRFGPEKTTDPPGAEQYFFSVEFIDRTFALWLSNPKLSSVEHFSTEAGRKNSTTVQYGCSVPYTQRSKVD